MARPQNTELKERIEQAASELFSQVGYDATTYAAIAKRCGISRNLVQYHYKKKELLAIAFMKRLLASVQENLGYTDDDLEGNITAIYQVGVGFFTSLVQDEGYRTFLQDILRGRDLTETILVFDNDWALSHLRVYDEQHRDEILRSVIRHMGGFYELLYYSLKNDQPMDIEEELKRVVRAWAEAAGRKF